MTRLKRAVIGLLEANNEFLSAIETSSIREEDKGALKKSTKQILKITAGVAQLVAWDGYDESN